MRSVITVSPFAQQQSYRAGWSRAVSAGILCIDSASSAAVRCKMIFILPSITLTLTRKLVSSHFRSRPFRLNAAADESFRSGSFKPECELFWIDNAGATVYWVIANWAAVFYKNYRPLLILNIIFPFSVFALLCSFKLIKYSFRLEARISSIRQLNEY